MVMCGSHSMRGIGRKYQMYNIVWLRMQCKEEDSDWSCKAFFEDNSIGPNDKCWKMQPTLDMIQQRCQNFGILTTAINVNESTVLQKILAKVEAKDSIETYKIWSQRLFSRVQQPVWFQSQCGTWAYKISFL